MFEPKDVGFRLFAARGAGAWQVLGQHPTLPCTEEPQQSQDKNLQLEPQLQEEAEPEHPQSPAIVMGVVIYRYGNLNVDLRIAKKAVECRVV